MGRWAHSRQPIPCVCALIHHPTLSPRPDSKPPLPLCACPMYSCPTFNLPITGFQRSARVWGVLLSWFRVYAMAILTPPWHWRGKVWTGALGHIVRVEAWSVMLESSFMVNLALFLRKNSVVLLEIAANSQGPSPALKGLLCTVYHMLPCATVPPCNCLHVLPYL